MTNGWYAIGFADFDDNINWSSAPIYEYSDGTWLDDSGNEVESFYDPHLQMPVATDAADAYVRQ